MRERKEGSEKAKKTGKVKNIKAIILKSNQICDINKTFFYNSKTNDIICVFSIIK